MEMNVRKYVGVWVFLCLVLLAEAQTKMPPAWQSAYVQINDNGQLLYHPDSKGNIIPDFSRVGYHHGDKSIPAYPVSKEISPVRNGDSGQLIQNAIDEISRREPDANGHRGTILLKRGDYYISGNIRITTGGIILKGEGDRANETRLIATGKAKRSLIEIRGNGKSKAQTDKRKKITDTYVPVGSFYFHVNTAQGLQSGDRILLTYRVNDKWIHDLQMDRIVERQGTLQWKAEEYQVSFERRITHIENNKIYIDNPVMMEINKEFGGAEICPYSFDGRIQEVGISDLCLESEFDHYEDNEHGWIGISLDCIENGWVSNVTARYFAYAAVSCEEYAKNITVTNCRSLEPKSVITGGLRYSFNNCGQQNLFMNCLATEGRHDYVTGARVCGPNVFYNCSATQTYADIGPHHRWSVGTLYDNIITDGEINVQDRGNWGSGHGWSGVTQILWNCRAKQAAVQNPWVSGNNYNIGMKGKQYPGRFPERNSGIWEGQNEENIFPRSLYIAQLMFRQKKD